MLKKYLQEGCTVKVIGDSLAAGSGSSGMVQTGELVFADAIGAYYRREAPRSWWGLLQKYLRERYPKSRVENRGCGGAFSCQIAEQLPRLVSPEDQVVLLLFGVNDRKRPEGMEELARNAPAVLEKLAAQGKYAVLLTPTPSTAENEYLPNRLHHTPQVVEILREAAGKAHVPLVDLYGDTQAYLQANGLIIDDIIFGEGCKNDGLHPGDFLQKLMFESVVKTLGI